MTNKYVFEAVPMSVEVCILNSSTEFYPVHMDELEANHAMFWAVYKRLNGTGPARHVMDFYERVDAQKMAYEANRSTL